MSWSETAHTVLENDYVRLRPLEAADRNDLAAIAFDADIWRYFVGRIDSADDLDRFLSTAIDDTRAGRRVVYGIIDKASGRLAGSMAFGNLAEADRRLEIGWSWLGRAHRGNGVNRWAKYLMLEHAFETLGAERVEFKTDVLNIQACKGLANIGATKEGIFRSYNIMPGGRRRDAVYYSILRREWPIVKAGLQAGRKLPRPASELAV